jgi:hypothetical protein
MIRYLDEMPYEMQIISEHPDLCDEETIGDKAFVVEIRHYIARGAGASTSLNISESMELDYASDYFPLTTHKGEVYFGGKHLSVGTKVNGLYLKVPFSEQWYTWWSDQSRQDFKNQWLYVMYRIKTTLVYNNPWFMTGLDYTLQLDREYPCGEDRAAIPVAAYLHGDVWEGLTPNPAALVLLVVAIASGRKALKQPANKNGPNTE